MRFDTNVVVLLGPPGSGKGTQAAWLSRYLRIPAISTGEMLRQEMRSLSPIGQAVGQILSSGQLVGDSLMNEVVASRVDKPDCERGFILDGYPRTATQAAFLDGLLGQRNIADLTVIDFQISARQIVTRLSGRRQCPACGKIASLSGQPLHRTPVCEVDGAALVRRSDDEPSVIRERLRVYKTASQELRSYYRDRSCHTVDAARAPQEVSRELASLFSHNQSHPLRSRKNVVYAVASA